MSTKSGRARFVLVSRHRAYRALHRKGMSKSTAVRISNAGAHVRSS
ncbi:hypothetical protein [Pseudonocardia sp.]